MQIEIKIDENCPQPKIIIVADKMTDEINELVKKISAPTPSILAGFRNSEVIILDPEQLVLVYAANQKVYAVTDSGEYTLKTRLYEIEEWLCPLGFVRISSSEIINLKHVKELDMSFSGTICVHFKNGLTAYASRRYVKRIKQVLGI